VKTSAKYFGLAVGP